MARRPEALEVLLIICALTQTPASAADLSSHRPSNVTSQAINPPRVRAHTISEYRELSINDPEYLRWTNDNIFPINYETDEMFYVSTWDDVLSASNHTRNEVVLVTQTTISRIPMLVSTAFEWGGPVSVAIYLEFGKGSEGGRRCRDTVVDFMRKMEFAQPLAVSFLYAWQPPLQADCKMPSFTGRDEFERTYQAHGTDGLGASKPLRNGQLPSHRVSRRLRQSPTRFYSVDESHLRGRDYDRKNVYTPCRAHQGIKPAGHPDVSWRDIYNGLYPVNALRNLAWQAVPPRLFVFLSDIDFVPTPTLYEELVEGRWSGHISDMRSAFEQHGDRRALVVPAFETKYSRDAFEMDPGAAASRCRTNQGCRLIRGHPTPRTLPALKAALKGSRVDVFHRRKFPGGHSCYSWLTWLQNYTPTQTMEMEYKHPCEPYVIAYSDATPRYDERYRGRGQNKVEQLTHMASWGFTFSVLPEHFVVHLPHPPTSQQSVQRAGGDVYTMPLALIRIQMREVAHETETVRSVSLRFPDDPLNCYG